MRVMLVCFVMVETVWVHLFFQDYDKNLSLMQL